MIFITDLPKENSPKIINDWLNKINLSKDFISNKKVKGNRTKPIINRETTYTEYVRQRSKPIIRTKLK